MSIGRREVGIGRDTIGIRRRGREMRVEDG